MRLRLLDLCVAASVDGPLCFSPLGPLVATVQSVRCRMDAHEMRSAAALVPSARLQDHVVTALQLAGHERASAVRLNQTAGDPAARQAVRAHWQEAERNYGLAVSSLLDDAESHMRDDEIALPACAHLVQAASEPLRDWRECHEMLRQSYGDRAFDDNHHPDLARAIERAKVLQSTWVRRGELCVCADALQTRLHKVTFPRSRAVQAHLCTLDAPGFTRDRAARLMEAVDMDVLSAAALLEEAAELVLAHNKLRSSTFAAAAEDDLRQARDLLGQLRDMQLTGERETHFDGLLLRWAAVWADMVRHDGVTLADGAAGTSLQCSRAQAPRHPALDDRVVPSLGRPLRLDDRARCGRLSVINDGALAASGQSCNAMPHLFARRRVRCALVFGSLPTP